MDKIQKLKELLAEATHVAAITGAGISTESDIPDFRSQGGLYNTAISPVLFSPWYIRWLPDRWYRKLSPMYMRIANSQPNTGHKALQRLEEGGKHVTVLTQNIDGLHQAAGSKHVLELHGTLSSLTCMKCGKHQAASAEGYKAAARLGKAIRCTCGGCMRPDIVMFGERLPYDALDKAKVAVMEAQVVLVIGTSAKVSTVKNLLKYNIEGTPIVVVNNEATAVDGLADIVINDSIGKVLDAVC